MANCILHLNSFSPNLYMKWGTQYWDLLNFVSTISCNGIIACLYNILNFRFPNLEFFNLRPIFVTCWWRHELYKLFLQSSLNDAFCVSQKSTSSNVKSTNSNATSNYRASPSLTSQMASQIPDVVSSARSEHSVVSMIKEEFKNPIRPPRRKKSSLPSTPVEVCTKGNLINEHLVVCCC